MPTGGVVSATGKAPSPPLREEVSNHAVEHTATESRAEQRGLRSAERHPVLRAGLAAPPPPLPLPLPSPGAHRLPMGTAPEPPPRMHDIAAAAAALRRDSRTTCHAQPRQQRRAMAQAARTRSAANGASSVEGSAVATFQKDTTVHRFWQVQMVSVPLSYPPMTTVVPRSSAQLRTSCARRLLTGKGSRRRRRAPPRGYWNSPAAQMT